MTDNDLRTLLRDAADDVTVPRLATDELHLRTRSVRRRRRAGWVAGAAALVLAGGIGTYALGGTLGDSGPDIAAAEGDPRGWAVAEGGAVHFGDGTTVTYGWLVRVVDLGKGEKVADVPISGKYTWAGWKTPPVAVDGEHAYVALDDRTLDVEWRAGRVSTSKGLPVAYTTEVINGRAVEGDVGGPQRVVDVTTGEVLLSVRSSDYPDGLVTLRLAPDGQHVLASPYMTCDEHDNCREATSGSMYDLSLGTKTTVELGDRFGWTPEGQVIRAAGTKVETCDEEGRECAAAPIELRKGVSTVSGTMHQS